MNVKGLLTIVIKVLGLFMLPELFSVLGLFIRSWEIFSYESDLLVANIAYVGFTFASLALYILVLRLLLFKTHILINRITTNDDLESEFSSFKIHRSSILTICVIVIGGITLLNEIPNLIRDFYLYKIESNNFSDNSPGHFQFIILSGVKVALGLYLVYNSRFIVGWIEKTRKTNKNVQADL